MPALTINGITVSVADGQASRTFDAAGERGRSIGGALRVNRKWLKRKWEFETPWLNEEDAKALIPLIQGRGDYWYCANAYSQKGAAPLTYPAAPNVRVGESSANQGIIYTGEPQAEAGSTIVNAKQAIAAIEFVPAGTNLLTANQAACASAANTAGFVAIGTATLTAQYLPSTAYQGSYVLQVAAAAPGDGAQTNTTVTAAANQPFTFVVYLLAASGTPNATVVLYDNTNNVTGTKTVAISSTAWTRVEVTITAGAVANPTLYCRVFTSGNTTTLYWGAAMLTQASYGTSWFTAGAFTPMPSQQYFVGELGNADDLSIMFWARSHGSVGTGARVAFEVLDTFNAGAGAGSGFIGYCPSGTNDFALSLLNAGVLGGASLPLTKTNAFPDKTTWHHIACVARRNPNALYSPTLYNLELYYDGALVTGANVTLPSPTTGTVINSLTWGGDATNLGYNPWTGLFSGMQVLPYAVTPGQVATHYARANSPTYPSPYNTPAIAVNGDLIGTGADLQCFGDVTGVQYGQAQFVGGFFVNAMKVRFSIEEA